MIIGVEGCIGVGKSTLVRLLTQALHCHPLFEQVETNPFLAEFYQAKEKLARHVQYTFLFLQEYQLRQVMPISQQGELVICDYHPLKSLVFANVLFPEKDRPLLSHLYQDLCIPQPDLLIYLTADEHTILSRVRQRNDPYMDSIDISYLLQIRYAYDAFIRAYPGPVIAIDTSRLDYVRHPEKLTIPLHHMQAVLDVFAYLRSTQPFVESTPQEHAEENA